MNRDRQRIKVLMAMDDKPRSTVDLASRADLRCEDTRSALESLRRRGLVEWSLTEAAMHVRTPLGGYVAGLVRAGQP